MHKPNIQPMLFCALLAGAAGASVVAPRAAWAEQTVEISFAQAERIALERVPGGTIKEIERELKRGQLVYEVDVRGPEALSYEIVIDAHDGRILSAHIDD